MQALEYAEQPVYFGHVKADTIVLDTKDALLASVKSVYLHAWARSCSAVLDRVRDQVDPYLTQQRVVAPGLRQGADRNFRVRAAIGRSQVGAHRSEEHTSELQSLAYLVCRLLLEKKKKNNLLKFLRDSIKIIGVFKLQSC